MRKVLRTPSMGFDCNDAVEGIRGYRFKSHVLYYAVTDQSVRIVRILHIRMSPRRHLA
jgi:toxin ParE1/3/4